MKPGKIGEFYQGTRVHFSPFKKYIISFFTVIIFSIIQYVLWPWIGPAPFLLLYPAIIISAIYGDGNLAILLGAIFGQYFFIPPFDKLMMKWPNDYIRLVTFLITSFMIKKIIKNEISTREGAQKAEALALNREKELRKEHAARDRFISMLNHDLRNPLTAIKTSSELMLKKTNDASLIERHLQKQLSNIKRLEEMIHDLLDANKIQAGSIVTLNFEKTNLREVIEEVVTDLQLIYGERFILDGTGTYYGYWNPGGIQRVLDNLCTNAVKYGDKEAPIVISYEPEKNGVIVAVKNVGNPISEEDIPHLFDPYWQIEKGSQGWGIGLTLVKGLVEAHKGKLDVRSDASGTVFSFYLPFNP